MSQTESGAPNAEAANSLGVTGYEDVVRRGWRAPGWWWCVLVAAPLVLGVVGGLSIRAGVEADLATRSLAALKAAGFSTADVRVDGRDAQVTIPAGADSAKALSVLLAVDGVRVAEMAPGDVARGGPSPSASTSMSATASAASPAATASTPIPFGVSRTASGVVLSGAVPDEATRAALVDAAKAAAGGATVTDQFTVGAGVPPTGLPSAANLSALVAALPTGSGATTANNGITITGQVASDAAKLAAAAAVAAAFPGAPVSNQLTVAASATANECPALSAKLTDLQGSNPIRFGTNATSLTNTQQEQLRKLAGQLVACLGKTGAPSAILVTGHADSTGSVALNDRLSVARAESVRVALIAGGVPADMITAKGLGVTAAVADNDTAEGRAANRRVEISVK